MKKVLFGLSLLFALHTATAQNGSKALRLKNLSAVENTANLAYTFNMESAPFEFLAGATSLNNSSIWDDPFYFLPLPFPLTVQGQTVDTLVLEGLGASLLGFQTNNPLFTIIAPFEADLIDRGYDSIVSLSPISYKIDGTAGNRIFKIEWKEAGSYGEYSNTGGVLNMYISFQAWIYEGSNILEYRYGVNTINDPSTFYEGDPGALIGTALTDGNTSIIPNVLGGSAANPSFGMTLLPITGTPASGTVYRLTPIGSSSSVTENQLSHLLNAWPNPVTDLLRLKLKNQEQAQLSLYNLQGQKVKQQLLTESRSSLDLSDLPAGAYLIRMEGQAGSMRIIKR